MTAIGDSLRWEPGSLTTGELDRVLTDALADLFQDSLSPATIREFHHREFRTRLERAVEHATGIPLAGLPARPEPAPAQPWRPDRLPDALALGYAADVPVTPEEDASVENAPVPLAAVPRRRHSLHEAGHKGGDR